MAIAHVATGFGDADSGGTGVSFALNAGAGSDRYLFVSIGWNNPNTPTVSAITYNGVALTLLGTAGTTDFKLAQYGMKHDVMATGSNTLAVTMSATTEVHMGASVYTGVDQATPTSGWTSAADLGDNQDLSLAVTSTSDGLVVDGWVAGGGVYTVGAGQTERWNDLAYDYRHGGSSEPGNGGTVTMSWTHTGTDTDTHGACNLRAAAGGGAPLVVFLEEPIIGGSYF